MGIAALGPKPRTTKPAPGHTIYSYLVRDMTVERSNQVWAADIADRFPPPLPASGLRCGSTSRTGRQKLLAGAACWRYVSGRPRIGKTPDHSGPFFAMSRPGAAQSGAVRWI